MSGLGSHEPTFPNFLVLDRSSFTAAQRTLGISELLSLVVGHLRNHPGSLASCARVNSYWFAHTVKLLWRKLPRDPESLMNIEPRRKAMYLGHVEEAWFLFKHPRLPSKRGFTPAAFIECMKHLPALRKLKMNLRVQEVLREAAHRFDEHAGVDYLRLKLYPPYSRIVADVLTLVRRLPSLRVLILPHMPAMSQAARMLTEALPNMEYFEYHVGVDDTFGYVGFTGLTTEALLEGFAANAPALRFFICNYTGPQTDGVDLVHLVAARVVFPELLRLDVHIAPTTSPLELLELLRLVAPKLGADCVARREILARIPPEVEVEGGAV